MIRGRNPCQKRIAWSPHAWSVPHPVESCSLLWRNSTSIFFPQQLRVTRNLFNRILERFSFECRKEIGFAFCMPHDWLKNLAPLFYPIRSETKINRDSLARIFPRFASATCNYLRASIGSLDCLWRFRSKHPETLFSMATFPFEKPIATRKKSCIWTLSPGSWEFMCEHWTTKKSGLFMMKDRRLELNFPCVLFLTLHWQALTVVAVIPTVWLDFSKIRLYQLSWQCKLATVRRFESWRFER